MSADAVRHLRDAEEFTNPIVPAGADPWVIYADGGYYYCHVPDGSREIAVSRAERLPDIGRAPAARVWAAPEGKPHSDHIWAPELHRLHNRWYIYFAADDGENKNHRMYVLEGDAADPQRPFEFRGRVADPTDRWAIDGTVLTHDGAMYFVWSGWEGYENVRQNLYIAPMSDPLTISGERFCISTPRHDWEKKVEPHDGGGPHVNEGPQVLRRDGRLFIIYSASGSWTDDYCLGQLTYTGGSVLSADSWSKKDAPVFEQTGHVFGPGHACFVKTPDGGEDWMVYHTAKYRRAGWNRHVRAQPFTWHADGSPDFGAPVPDDDPLIWPAPRASGAEGDSRRGAEG
jgi:GH43 family beta-xylosidase